MGNILKPQTVSRETGMNVASTVHICMALYLFSIQNITKGIQNLSWFKHFQANYKIIYME
jgi:hypothetical protein